MPHDYIPRPDGGFDAWVANFWPAVQAFYNDQGLDVGELDALEEALAAWAEKYALHVAAQAAARAARADKDQARLALDAAIRPVVRFVQAFPQTTDADRAEMGITVRDTARTRAGVPSSRPRMVVAEGGRLTHQLRLVDESTLTSGRSGRARRARPRGVGRAEVFLALTPPGSPAPAPPPIGEPGGGDYRYIGSVTRGETTLSFESDKGGMQAHYLSRWVSTSGATGPWSDTASATVAA